MAAVLLGSSIPAAQILFALVERPVMRIRHSLAKALPRSSTEIGAMIGGGANINAVARIDDGSRKSYGEPSVVVSTSSAERAGWLCTSPALVHVMEWSLSFHGLNGIRPPAWCFIALPVHAVRPPLDTGSPHLSVCQIRESERRFLCRSVRQD
jgi:hypothetical protein